MGAVGTYQIFNSKGQQAGGMMKKMDREPAAHWLYYITSMRSTRPEIGSSLQAAR